MAINRRRDGLALPSSTAFLIFSIDWNAGRRPAFSGRSSSNRTLPFKPFFLPTTKYEPKSATAKWKYEPKSNSTFSSMIGAMYCANSICAFDLFAPVVPRYPPLESAASPPPSREEESLFGAGRLLHQQIEKYALTSARALSAPALSALARLRKSPTSRVDGSHRPLARRRPSPHLGRARRPTSRESGVPIARTFATLSRTSWRAHARGTLPRPGRSSFSTVA